MDHLNLVGSLIKMDNLELIKNLFPALHAVENLLTYPDELRFQEELTLITLKESCLDTTKKMVEIVQLILGDSYNVIIKNHPKLLHRHGSYYKYIDVIAVRVNKQ